MGRFFIGLIPRAHVWQSICSIPSRIRMQCCLFQVERPQRFFSWLPARRWFLYYEDAREALSRAWLEVLVSHFRLHSWSCPACGGDFFIVEKWEPAGLLSCRTNRTWIFWGCGKDSDSSVVAHRRPVLVGCLDFYFVLKISGVLNPYLPRVQLGTFEPSVWRKRDRKPYMPKKERAKRS